MNALYLLARTRCACMRVAHLRPHSGHAGPARITKPSTVCSACRRLPAPSSQPPPPNPASPVPTPAPLCHTVAPTDSASQRLRCLQASSLHLRSQDTKTHVYIHNAQTQDTYAHTRHRTHMHTYAKQTHRTTEDAASGPHVFHLCTKPIPLDKGRYIPHRSEADT